MKYILKICYVYGSKLVICETLKDALNVISEVSFKDNIRKITLKRVDEFATGGKRGYV